MKRCFFILILLATQLPGATAQSSAPLTTGYIDYRKARLEELLPRGTKIEVIGSGYQHIEGPVWVADSSMLLFSDTKAGIIYRWRPDDTAGATIFLKNAGFSGRLPYSEEPGNNGLALDGRGNLLICQHGDRRISAYPLSGKYGQRTITDNYGGRRYNSPNDLVVQRNGVLWFTDPPYGLPGKEHDPTRALPFCGVFRKAPDYKAEVVIRDLPKPNGIALSPNERLLYVSVSDSLHPRIMVYTLGKDGWPEKGRVFFDASGLPRNKPAETTDGLKTDGQGNVWATGPGGLLVLSSHGELLGIIRTGEVMSNCAWGADGWLYITAGGFLYRVMVERSS